MSESMEYYRNDLPQCELYTWQDEMAAENAVNYLKTGKRMKDHFSLRLVSDVPTASIPCAG